MRAQRSGPERRDPDESRPLGRHIETKNPTARRAGWQWGQGSKSAAPGTETKDGIRPASSGNKVIKHFPEPCPEASLVTLRPEDLDALYQLGVRYLQGGGVPEEHSTAVTLLSIAAGHDHAEALLALGSLHQHGNGVRRNPERAVHYFSRAAAKGQVVAQFNLGFCYEKGDGIRCDLREAVRWYRIAADRGDEAAKTALAELAPDQARPARQPKLRVL